MSRPRLALAALAACAAMVLSGCGADGDTATSSESTALLACYDAVKADVRNPATVDIFQTATTAKESLGGWEFNGEMTAKNDFGVKTQFHWRCQTDAGGAVVRQGIVPG